jgi:hypothetical protein
MMRLGAIAMALAASLPISIAAETAPEGMVVAPAGVLRVVPQRESAERR